MKRDSAQVAPVAARTAAPWYQKSTADHPVSISPANGTCLTQGVEIADDDESEGNPDIPIA